MDIEPPLIASGKLLAPTPGRSSRMSPAVLSTAELLKVNWPRDKSGGGVWVNGTPPLSARIYGEISNTVKLSVPPTALTLPAMSLLAPNKVIEPRADAAKATSAGTVRLPSLL